MIVGHRGAAALAPENTLAGLNKAADSGIHWIEIDTQLTADGIPVIFHDETLERCTNGSGKLASHTLSELKQLDAGSWFDGAFAGEKIPTLEEALQTCLDKDLFMNLEIKIHHDVQVVPLVKKISDVLKSIDFPNERLLLSSFSKHAVEQCKTLLPDIRRGYITEEKSTEYLNEIEHLSLFSVHVNQEMLTSDMAKSITDKGYTLNIWTLNDPDKLNDFIQMKVDNVITDNPELF
ncbi:glycerophosphodiester phosphodiesterase family protein [Vibrio algarum]|uniref:Glycerophosphodiester phosphodiesterase family protein n=1 Tax=Vibrio algarum TaxID=3020714 RepID=A0ABT4YVH4_9VIBR|nr:glycerophosphodiester phosphodiesterase family protein [Vibrio sp. KJ40-1]MDB1125588.1 glycerophosphodiester phosphodiesterase family protein [Vibrio sp. KJ40-1]